MSNQQFSPRINAYERNVLIDGSMMLWPEGTSRTVTVGNSLYGAVMFKCNNSGTGISVVNSRIGGPDTQLVYANQISKTAAGTIASGAAVNLEYGIEGNDLEPLMAEEFTVLFKVKSSVASTRSVSIRNSTGSHSYVQQYNITAANTWQVKAIKFNPMNTCPGTLNRDNNIGALLDFSVIAGSALTTNTLNQWVAGGFLTGPGEDTTWITGTNHDFAIAGAMILSGDWTAIANNPSYFKFVRAGRNHAHEVQLSKRYYEKSWQLADVPGTVTSTNRLVLATVGDSAGNHTFTVQLEVEKRAIPTAVIYAAASGGANGVTAYSTNAAQNGYVFGPSDPAANVLNSGTKSIVFNAFSYGSYGPGRVQCHYTADARF